MGSHQNESNRTTRHEPARSCIVHADLIPAQLLAPYLISRQLNGETSRCTLLGRLAVDQGQRGKGLGEYLLMDALHRSLDAAAEIAAMEVIVDAKDKEAVAFNERYGFIPLQRQPARLFLSMATVTALLP